MNLRWLKAAALMTAVGIFGSGCIINVSPSRAAYDSCNTGDNCAGLTICQASRVVLAGGVAGNFCTESCSGAGSCPLSANGAGVCVIPAGTSLGQCFAPCSVGGACPAGSTCGAIPTAGGGAVNVCVPGSGGSAPCGAAGQACCGGASCTEAGTTCASDGVCKPAAYVGCSAGRIGAQCTDAPNRTGLRVQTTCQRPQFVNAGPTGFCSAVCNGTNESCPTFPGSTTGCYTFQGMTAPMCFVDCVNNPNICPTGTQCVMLTSNSGAQVRVCAPPVL